MYVFVREDLSRPQQVVQATHAVYELMKRGNAPLKGFPEECPASIVLGVKDLKSLEEVKKFLEEESLKFGYFCESDLNGELTALCTYPLPSMYKPLFRKFHLLK